MLFVVSSHRMSCPATKQNFREAEFLRLDWHILLNRHDRISGQMTDLLDGRWVVVEIAETTIFTRQVRSVASRCLRISDGNMLLAVSNSSRRAVVAAVVTALITRLQHNPTIKYLRHASL